MSQQHDALLGDVVQFVERARKQWSDVAANDNQLAAAILPPYLTMIPTASIILGIIQLFMLCSVVEMWVKRFCNKHVVILIVEKFR